MMIIKRASVLKADKFTLYIIMVKEEAEYYITGMLENNGNVEEFCKTDTIKSCNKANEIYDIMCRYRVFPSHFECIMEDYA